ncbi:MAG TPA: L-glutamate gamma-semialdehyde dehydrogenase [Candidatus Krumholzibacteria bacterium]|nr:L-glutamate gamma-semialdehyde dehydrogenase [Candidatus Krumholzibacteria bacterium]HPD71678.1 L-glutamate gamma-semialdehyde dehydrogenase [Candidatus Krumholzibacteria bacterium]HRY41389.1 L-glutamate gamma-semialdehyde dehydrogenase [Candidatus Krumholzibacteria bacterium]
MAPAIVTVPIPENEPVLGYAPGSAERQNLQASLAELSGARIEIPLVIGGEEIRTGRLGTCVMPHDHAHVLATYHQAGRAEVKLAIRAALKARAAWAAMPWQQRTSILLKAAELLAGPWRATVNAATMLCQSKTPYEAEIDAACELIDFWRFNPYFYEQIISDQPPYSPTGVWNYVEQRPLDGFVFAVTPFNFTSIAGNLPTAPALCGNTVVWKPASSTVYSNYFVLKVLEEAGLPPGVINFVPGRGADVGQPALASRDLAGIHFTGSTGVFQDMWRTVGRNIKRYGAYPRIVGETGGKGFVLAHASADVDALVTGLVRGAFEYQGQKCSAASRAFIPASLWPRVKTQLLDRLARVATGDVADFTNFMGAVIDAKAFASIGGYLDRARRADDRAAIVAGGTRSGETGYFIEPTVIECRDPAYETMVEEIFGPVLSVFVYEEKDLARTLKLIDRGSPYALTGAVFAQDRDAVVQVKNALSGAAGNFYINDKPTGAVVGQQPFGGSRASGTNDKAGSYLNLVRWVSPRAVKETFNPPREIQYPFMGSD